MSCWCRKSTSPLWYWYLSRRPDISKHNDNLNLSHYDYIMDIMFYIPCTAICGMHIWYSNVVYCICICDTQISTQWAPGANAARRSGCNPISAVNRGGRLQWDAIPTVTVRCTTPCLVSNDKPSPRCSSDRDIWSWCSQNNCNSHIYCRNLVLWCIIGRIFT